MEVFSSTGLTSKVVRGSAWSVGGQGVTLLASLVATPFVIRLLGPEGYGVLALINVLIGYLAFTDLGMGTASTRFGADAHARDDDGDGEAAVIWTSLWLAAVPSFLGAVALALLARPLSEHVLHLPANLIEQAVIALRLTAIGFIARTLAGVLNTPQLVRLRMDLFILINTGTTAAQICIVPIVLFLGGGLIGAVATVTCANVLALLLNALASWRLLPSLARPQLNSVLLRPLLKFGSALIVSSLVGMALISSERLWLTRFVSITALARYSVAYTLASLLVVLPAAINQSLIPAFSRLQARDTTDDLTALGQLYWRAQRGTLLWLAPAVVVVVVAAKPFITFWAGPDYASAVTPFYILVLGLIFNVMAFVPLSLLTALGRTNLIARYHTMELLPYLIGAAVLTYMYGPAGAATAWSLRVFADALLLFRAAKRSTGFAFAPTRLRPWRYVLVIAVLAFPVLIFSLLDNNLAVKAGALLIGLVAYAGLVWRKELSAEEKAWMTTSWGGFKHRPLSQKV